MARSGWISGNILAKAILISLSLWEFQGKLNHSTISKCCTILWSSEANALLTDCVCASTTCYQCACSSAALCDITMKILECVFLMNDECVIDLISCPSASCNGIYLEVELRDIVTVIACRNAQQHMPV